LRALIAALGLPWIHQYVGANFKMAHRLSAGETAVQTFPFILRSDFGEVLTALDCRSAPSGYSPSWFYRWRPAVRTWNGEGPVPYVHRQRGGHYHRHIATAAEHRCAANVLLDEGEPVFRAARNRHNLPSAYDDCPISGRRDRSWKRFRTTRWKS
jgi:hypothetical protein